MRERAAEEEVADDGRLVLAEAVNAAVALLEAVGVERQFKVQQVVAALVEVEAGAVFRKYSC